MVDVKKRKMPRVAHNREKGLRTCAACRQKFPRVELLRFVLDAEGQAWLDRHLKAPGRGAHLCYQRSCIERAVKRKSLSASFKRPVSLPELDVLLKLIVEAQLAKISDLISLAQRKRVVISGLNNLEATRQSVHGVLFASDIAAGSMQSLLRRVRTPQEAPLLAREEPRPHHGLASSARQAPFFSDEAQAWCESSPERSAWYATLVERWSSVTLGQMIGRAPRVAIGLTETDLNHRLNCEIQRISQVLVASLVR